MSENKNEKINYDKTFRVYLAGPLNSKDSVGYIKNLHAMSKKGSELIKQGYSVFIPGIDFLVGFLDGNWEYNHYFDNSQPWLIASHCVYTVGDWSGSKGTIREIGIASDNNIPVVDNDKDLAYYRDQYDRYNEAYDQLSKDTMLMEIESEYETSDATLDDIINSLEEEVGKKYDHDKLRYDLISVDALEGIAKVLTYGANKYSDDNWKSISPPTRYYAAAMRHIAEVLRGNDLDPESGLKHIDHAIVNLIFFRELTK